MHNLSSRWCLGIPVLLGLSLHCARARRVVLLLSMVLVLLGFLSY